MSCFQHGLGKRHVLTRRLVSVQATTVILLFTEHQLITCQPFYVTYLNLSSPQLYVTGPIIISVSQLSKWRLAEVKEP